MTPSRKPKLVLRATAYVKTIFAVGSAGAVFIVGGFSCSILSSPSVQKCAQDPEDRTAVLLEKIETNTCEMANAMPIHLSEIAERTKDTLATVQRNRREDVCERESLLGIVYFDKDSAELKGASLSLKEDGPAIRDDSLLTTDIRDCPVIPGGHVPTQMASIVENLKKLEEESVVLVEGYASTSGTAAYNLGLSERRAETVIRYLKQNKEIPHLHFKRIASGESYDEKTRYEEDTCRQKVVLCESRAADSFEPGTSNNFSDQHNSNQDCAVPSETEQTQTPATDSNAESSFAKTFMTISRSLCIIFPSSRPSDLKSCHSGNNGNPDQTDG